MKATSFHLHALKIEKKNINISKFGINIALRLIYEQNANRKLFISLHFLLPHSKGLEISVSVLPQFSLHNLCNYTYM